LVLVSAAAAAAAVVSPLVVAAARLMELADVFMSVADDAMASTHALDRSLDPSASLCMAACRSATDSA